MSSKKTKWTSKQWESHYEDFIVSKRLNTDEKKLKRWFVNIARIVLTSTRE
jgi:hypothetical protein